ncbi:hypothetical protein [Zobellella iuensis]|uniref:Uncharacterized protein n=1 Tax=Zobellella iuensis TaxID=2803811 RepID=A0ABS1QSB8_9GAMM|nr:hypothetical protein [Zobellella iuensis]MBL1377770.1 hypothetical protein [Zobellella iuensis]
MTLTIAAAAFCNWRQAEPIWQQLGLGSSQAAIELDTEAAMQQLAQSLSSPDNVAIVLYAPLDLALEQAAVTGVEPSQAITLWQLNTTQLVHFCKQQRGKALLFNLADLLAAPQVFQVFCAQHWPDLGLEHGPVPASQHRTPVLYRLLAQFLLSSTPSLRAQSQQLEALAQPLMQEPTPPALAELNQLVTDHHAGTEALAQLSDIKQESTLLLDQLHQVQGALESALQESTKQKAEFKAEQKCVKEQQAKIRSLQQQLLLLTQEHDVALQLAGTNSDLQQENTLLLDQLHQVQEALESALQEIAKQQADHKKSQNLAKEYQAKAHTLQQEKTLLLDELQQAQKKLASTLKENTQQKTEIEKTQKSVKDQQDKVHSQQQEIALLIEQLHHAQEELGSTLQSNKNQQTELKAEKNNIKNQQTKIHSLQQEMALLFEQLHHAQEELDSTLQSNKKQQTELKAAKNNIKNQQTKIHSLQQEMALLFEQLHHAQEALEANLLAQSKVPEAVVDTSASGQNNAALDSVPAVSTSLLKQKLQKRAAQKRLQRKAAELYKSPLFDAKWYLAQYPDVAADKAFSKNPALHYLKCGGFEGRNPGPDFNSRAYLNANPDVAAAGFNPLYHYLRFGKVENRALG